MNTPLLNNDFFKSLSPEIDPVLAARILVESLGRESELPARAEFLDAFSGRLVRDNIDAHELFKDF